MLLNKVNDLNSIYDKIRETENFNSTWKINEKIFIALLSGHYSVIFLLENKIDKKIITGKNIQLKILEQIEIKIEEKKIIKPGIVIECLTDDEEIKDAYIIFMTTIINNFYLLKDNAYEEFFKLWQLFERKRQKNEKSLIGLLGELLVIEYFIEKHNFYISKFYHENEYNKWDFEFSESLCMEVKTTLTDERKHTFSSLQVNNNIEIIIASVKLLIREKGISLFQLTKNLVKKIDDFNFSSKIYSCLFLNKINEFDQGPIIDYAASLNSIEFYLKSNLAAEVLPADQAQECIYLIGLRLRNFLKEDLKNIINLIEENNKKDIV